MRHDSGSIRFGCAKASLERNHRELFKEIVRNELPGEYQRMMLRCIRLRKKRDYTDAVQKLKEEDFDLPPHEINHAVKKKEGNQLEQNLRMEDYP
mmetsp:Transcript_35246/g.48156  ORF Transcript_35246/g.48156 Transcript_35246/m.48156 type:complete len:95 (+) Transcript_35246:1-285(+)